MFCEKCGKQIPDNSAFCDGCGSPIAAPAAEEPAATPVVEEVPVVETAVETPEKPERKLNKKALTGIVVVAAAVIVVILAIALIANAGGSSALLYVTEGELVMSTNVKKGETNLIDDEYVGKDLLDYYGAEAAMELSSMTMTTSDGKTLVYLADYDEDDDTFSLFCVPVKSLSSEKVSENIVKVASGVSWYELASDANALIYVKSGKLYFYDFKNDPVLVTKEVSNYAISDDGKHISYSKYDDDEEVLYVYTVKTAESEKLDSDIWTVLSYDLENNFAHMLYTKYNQDDSTYTVYTAGLGNEKEKLFSDANSIISAFAGAGIFYTEVDEDWVTTLYYFDITTGEKTEITDEFNSAVYSSAKNGVVVYSTIDEDYEHAYYVCAVGFDPVELDEAAAYALMNSDGNTLYLITYDEEDDEPVGTLYSYTLGKNGLSSATKLANEVYTGSLRLYNDVLYYYADYDSDDYTATLYSWTKSGNKLADEVRLGTLASLGEDEDVVFFVDIDDGHGTMYTTNGSSATKVSADVYRYGYTVYDGDLVFLMDYDEDDGGTLNLWNGKEKTKLASDVQAVIAIG